MADILVNNLGLSVRVSNALRRMHIDTLEQLLNTPMEEIKKGKNIGAKTIAEIDSFCNRYRGDGSVADILVNNLGLSVRASNALRRMHIDTLEQLLNTPMEEIEKGKNIGAKTIAEIDSFCNRYLNGDIDIVYGERTETVKKRRRTYSKDELEEMSRHAVTELNLSLRSKNALMRMECDTLSKLVMYSERELRDIKGIGAKSRDEILKERDAWLERNLYNINSEESEEVISEDEKLFYGELSQVLTPIKRLYWKQLRRILLVNHVMYIEDDYSLARITGGFICSVLKLDEFEQALKNYFALLAPDGIINMQELRKKLDDIDIEFDTSILLECLLNGKICKEKDGNVFLVRPNIIQYLNSHESDYLPRNYEAFVRHLRGESLQEIGDRIGISRERVRQIVCKIARKIAGVYEDYYSGVYEYFKFTKYAFVNAFPECGDEGYEYLSIKYEKGEYAVNNQSIENYNGVFKERLKQYWKEEKIRQDKKLTKVGMIYRVLMGNSDHSMTLGEFEKKYNEYLERKNYSKERWALNIHSVSNHLRTSRKIVFNKENKLRFFEVDSKVIWENIDFTRYRDLIISAELIYKDYRDLMEELDIRDGYELFYVIKSSLSNWNSNKFKISCRRVPIIVLGDGDEAKQALQLLKEISPISYYDYYAAYEERYGVRNAEGNHAIAGAIAGYYIDGEYSTDVIALDDADALALKAALAEKSFWFIDEVESLFREICVHSSKGALNKATLKRIGYSLNSGYLYSDNYKSAENYFGKEIFFKEIIDLSKYDQRLLGLASFKAILYKKRMDLEYIEVAPKVYMTVRKLECIYGLSVDDIHELQEWINHQEDKYFNAHSVWGKLCDAGLAEKLRENEWLCTCIFRQQTTMSSLQVGGDIILCKDNDELNIGTICQWLVNQYGKMTVQALTTKLNDTFATKVPVRKVGEKLKSFGLWDILVTDSFDEYIDNLIISTDDDMDIDDLLQEEFF